ncbi:MAG: hypothetical protein V4649_05625 [Bacteroidota bacterium]
MRLLLFAVCMAAATSSYGQRGWIAPEGKILNYRTLTWDDFQGKEDKGFADKLAENNLQARAYVCPAIYFTADSGQRLENGRVKFQFHVKCAFQSRAFVRESTKQEHSNYTLIHEQDHYDIALTYAQKLQETLSSRDYHPEKYNEEIDKIYEDLYKKHIATQERYDHEVNPDGRDEKQQQYLWDMRIKKCLENATDEYYSAPETVAQTVKTPWQTLKRLPGESAARFVVRGRPLYTELPQEMAAKIVETTEWTQEPAIIAFYSQKYYVQEDGALPTDHFRTFAYLFAPAPNGTYKRIFIDTLQNDGNPVRIAAAFFANADSDYVKELVIVATSTQKNGEGAGTRYINKVYDNIGRALPARLKKLDDMALKLEGGLEGIKDGKPSKAKFKSQKEIAEALKTMGY